MARRRKKSDTALGAVALLALFAWGVKTAWDAAPVWTALGGAGTLGLIVYAANSNARKRAAAQARSAELARREILESQLAGHRRVIDDCVRFCRESANASTRESRARVGIERLDELGRLRPAATTREETDLRAYFAAVAKVAVVEEAHRKSATASAGRRAADQARRAVELAATRGVTDADFAAAGSLAASGLPLSLDHLRKVAAGLTEGAPKVEPAVAASDTRPAAQPAVSAAKSPPPNAAREAPVRGSPRPVWIPLGRPVEVDSRSIPFGMIYVGDVRSTPDEPALIDPALPVDWPRADLTGDDLGYWPSYGRASPAQRAGYLNWLIAGRRDPRVSPGYVFLFFYGIERRVLIDEADADPTERKTICDELDGLLGTYGESRSVRNYVGSLREFVAARDVAEAADCPANGGKGAPPLGLAVAIARDAETHLPLTPALGWAWVCSTDRGRTLTERSPCPQVLRRLFEIRFGGLEGDLRVRLARSPQRVTHAPASAALQGRTFERELALRTFAATDPALDRALRTLEDAVEELGPYSRLIRKFPEASDSIRAVALLPPELVDDAKAAEVEVLRRALAERLAEGEFAAIDGSDLLRFWPVEEGGRLGKAEASKFIQLLAKLRVGVEPDVRFGGPPLSPEAGAVLFAMSEGLSHREPSPAYRAAAAMIQLSAAAVAVDGKFADAEIAYLDREAERLRSSLALDAVELRRLRAVARRAMRTPPSLAGLKSQFEPLSVEERRRIGRFLVGTTAVDGRIDAAEIKFLGRAYKALGLDPATVHADVHAATAAPLPAEEPVRMREERRTPDGQPIPLAPQGALAAGVPPAVVLNPELVARTLRETDEVGLLLARVFAEAPPPAIPTSTPKDAGKSEVGGLVLESRHGALLRELLTQATWSRADFEAKARGHGLMPDGALEKINEAAFEAWDAPAIEGEDPLEVAIDLFGKVEP